jgi:hypothetical protein
MSVEQFAYLKCPDKIRVAMINAGLGTPTIESVKRALDRLPKRNLPRIGEPRDCDAIDYVRPHRPKKVRQIVTPEERARIAQIAATIPDKPEPNPLRLLPKDPNAIGGNYGKELLEMVLRELGISDREFWGRRRKRYAAGAASLVATVLRKAHPTRYTYPMIARILGRNDHSTMIYAVQQWPVYAKMFPEMAVLYESIIATLPERGG